MHECSSAAVYGGVHKEERREVVFSSFNFPRTQTCGDHRKRLSIDRNSKQQLFSRIILGGQFIISTSRYCYSKIILFGSGLGLLPHHYCY